MNGNASMPYIVEANAMGIRIPGRRGHKYNAKRTEHRGRSYPSKAQAEHAAGLDMLKRSGRIRGFLEEVKVELGARDRCYRVDFVVVGNDGRAWAEEVKGVETAGFKLQKSLWRDHAPMEMRVFRRGKLAETIVPDGTDEDEAP